MLKSKMKILIFITIFGIICFAAALTVSARHQSFAGSHLANRSNTKSFNGIQINNNDINVEDKINTYKSLDDKQNDKNNKIVAEFDSEKITQADLEKHVCLEWILYLIRI